MFNPLRIAVAMAVIGMVGLTAMYWSDEIFGLAEDRDGAGWLLNASQQIAGAIEIYQGAGKGMPESLRDITPNYLTAIPGGEEMWEYDQSTIATTVEDEDICRHLNIFSGITNSLHEPIPNCMGLNARFERDGVQSDYYCCHEGK